MINEDLLTAEDIEKEEDGEQVQEGEEALVVVQGAETHYRVSMSIITNIDNNIIIVIKNIMNITYCR